MNLTIGTYIFEIKKKTIILCIVWVFLFHGNGPVSLGNSTSGEVVCVGVDVSFS
jgi:hypothetical protein